MKNIFFIIILLFTKFANSQVWQWSVRVGSVISDETNNHPQAFLWIPENCNQVKGVVFTQHNMVEEGILEHPIFRRTMAKLGFAEIWVTPGLTVTFDFNKAAPDDFNYMMKALADESGYAELTNAPIIPMGHSALASFPWNFAAWNPDKTLALVSVHGDAPLTNLTGSGRPNPDWGSRSIDGVPSLFIMGEYEWWEDRIKPAFYYISKHPNSVITLFCDAGHGHFDYSDEMVEYVCEFIKRAAHKRLSGKATRGEHPVLIAIKPESGWLMDRWRRDSLPTSDAAPYSLYRGDRKTASWIFDKEMADATEKFYNKSRGKKNQFIGFRQNGQILQPQKTHANYHLKFFPESDGISFYTSAFFSDSSRTKQASSYAKTKLHINRICGPVQKINDSAFQLSFYRMGFNNAKRSNDIWLLAHNSGDDKYKSAVQQANMKFPIENMEGATQSITFPTIHNEEITANSITLRATASSGLPVYYYVKEGPALVRGNKLLFTGIPPRAKLPIRVTVVAWQYGISGRVQSAKPIEQFMYISRR